MHTDALVVLTTLASEEEAVTLVRELLAVPVEAGLDRYLEWIAGETTLALS